jgi:conjugative relaxase-like TrwC/TraI family protein
MLTVSPMTSGVDYYEKAVRERAEEYYQGVGEAPGRWAGRAAREQLDLAGDVDSPDLQAVFAGEHPATGDALGVFNKRTVIGFDLTFKAPKSVSLLMALGSPEIAAQVIEAHEAAVDAALEWIETNVARTRIGKGGVVQVETDGIVAAKFRHRTSRAGDPHLHTHVLVANAVQGPDGRWRTLDGRMLYTHAKTGGYLYEAALRHELTSRLGVDWEVAVNGIADVSGIDRSVLEHFSDRRKQVLEHMDKLGYRSARAADIATLETRTKKDTSIDEPTMRDVWRAKAAEIDFDPDTVADVLGATAPRSLTADELTELFEHLAGPNGLTARASTFDRRAVLEAIAEALPTGAPIADIEALADQFLASPELVRITDPATEVGLTTKDVIRLADGAIVATPSAGRWSTRDLVRIERQVVDQATSRVGEGSGVVAEDVLEAVLARRPTLAGEQALMVTRLVTSGNGVDVVSAAAGTGKTFTLDAARDAWEDTGYRVIGAAHTGQAARELQASAGIESHTLAMLQINLDAGRVRLDRRTVLLIDEAGMAGTRSLAPILDAAHHAGSKVVLVGDPRQLPEIAAGGVLTGLARRLEPIELVENRRQHHAWEITALDQLRDGNVETALDAYQRHGRIITASTAIDVRNQMVADWWSWQIAGDDTVMIVLRNSDADDLNARARTYKHHAGHLHGPELLVDDRPYQAGDEILCRRNDYRLDVRNGTRGTITAVDPDRRSVTMRMTDDRSVTLPAEYLDAGHIAHAYASTVWKTQGATYDRALILGTDELYQERGYVAFSRGRASNHLYLVGGIEPDRSTTHGPDHTQPDPADLVAAALQRQTTQLLAIDQGCILDVRSLDELVAEERRLAAVLATRPRDRSCELQSLTDRKADIEAELRPLADRHNELADQRLKRKATKQELATLQALISHAGHALDRLAGELAATAKHEAARQWFNRTHAPDARRLDDVSAAVERAVAERVRGYADQPPEYIVDRLGEPPVDQTKADAWARSASMIERYRVEHDIVDKRHAFGTTLAGLPATDPAEIRFELRSAAEPLLPPEAASAGLEPSL